MRGKSGNQRKRIYIVDDYAPIRKGFQKLLKRDGFEVDCYATGQQVWDALEKRRPDLVITDGILPFRNFGGLDLTRCIKEVFPSLPVVLMSGDEELLEQGEKEGYADFFLKKPFEVSFLRKLIRRLIF